jgi:hypothetical protein
MFLESEVRPVRRADKLPLSVSRLSRQCGILNIAQPHRPPLPVTGIALLFLTLFLYWMTWYAMNGDMYYVSLFCIVNNMTSNEIMVLSLQRSAVVVIIASSLFVASYHPYHPGDLFPEPFQPVIQCDLFHTLATS